MVEVFQDLCMSTFTSVCRQNVWSSDLLCNLGQDRVVEVFQDLCMSTITSVCRQNVWSSDLLCSLGQRTEWLKFFKTFA